MEKKFIFLAIFIFLILFLGRGIFDFHKVFAAGSAAVQATIKISVCGNNIKETGEQCDGSDLGGASCSSLGFSGGTLSCTAACDFDTSGCATVSSGGTCSSRQSDCYSAASPIPTPASTTTFVPTPTPTEDIIPNPKPVSIPTLPSNPTRTDYQNLLKALLQQLAYLKSLLSAQQGAVIPTPIVSPSGTGYKFIVSLAFRNSGEGVRQLQIFLKDQGTQIYPEGLITGYFGSATLRAVQRFQEKYGLAQAGDPGYGNVGPKTRAKINQLQGL